MTPNRFARITPGNVEECENNPDEALKVNVEGTRHLVDGAREIGAAVAFISSDAVFSGGKDAPYSESDVPDPQNVYGTTKVEAERLVGSLPRHFIFRIPVLFGPGGSHLVDRCLKALQRGERCPVASDQRGTTIHTVDAARTIRDVAIAPVHGLYHVSNQGECSRYELARQAAEFAGYDASLVEGCTSVSMSRHTPRAKRLVLSMNALQAAGLAVPRPWTDALEEYVRERSATPSS